MASAGGQTLWARGTHGNALVHQACVPLPDLGESFPCTEYNGRRFMGLLPLIRFLQEISIRARSWSASPPSACFIFDDPSLRQLRYGHLDFNQLLGVCRKHRFHAAVATIPLDSQRTSSAVSALFRSNPDWLSILIHGNNHTARELAQSRSSADWELRMAQALRRVNCLESKHQISPCKVMEPPHGVVCSELAPVLNRLGFEGLLVTPHQFLRVPGNDRIQPSLGLNPAGCFNHGLALIPRIVLSSTAETESALALAAGLPAVIAGHHQDAADGLERIARLADFINASADVTWCNPSRIARRLYWTEGSSTGRHVTLGSSQTELNAMDESHGATLTVVRPWIARGGEEALRVSHEGKVIWENLHAGREATFELTQRGLLQVQSMVRLAHDPVGMPDPPFEPWPVIRKAIMELRDRSQYWARVFPWSARNGSSPD